MADVVPNPTVCNLGASVPGGDFHVDYNQIIKHIEELNVLAGEGVAKIQHTTDGARLKVRFNLSLISTRFSHPFSSGW